jgi:Mrp family chromosome partitioning ATPase
VLESLRRGADLIVIATPPLTEPDGQALASVADAVVIVAPIGLATFSQLDAALAEAGRVHAHVLGVVAVHPASGQPPARSQPRRTGKNVVAGNERPPASATWVPT